MGIILKLLAGKAGPYVLLAVALSYPAVYLYARWDGAAICAGKVERIEREYTQAQLAAAEAYSARIAQLNQKSSQLGIELNEQQAEARLINQQLTEALKRANTDHNPVVYFGDGVRKLSDLAAGKARADGDTTGQPAGAHARGSPGTGSGAIEVYRKSEVTEMVGKWQAQYTTCQQRLSGWQEWYQDNKS